MKLIVLTLFLLPLSASADPWDVFDRSNGSFSTSECLMCKFSVSMVNYALKTRGGADQVYRIANSFCSLAKIESPLVCSNVTQLFKDQIVKVLSYGLFTPNQICGLISNNTCGNFHDPFADWEVTLKGSHSISQEKLARKRRLNKKDRAELKPFRVIHISDTHIDMNYQEGSIANCAEPLCCRASSNAASENISLSGYWGSYKKCDVPIRTLESALKFINSTMNANRDIKYVIWTGDIQPHNIWDQSKQQAVFTYDSVFEKVFEYLPDAEIFPTLGNHEMVPVDSFSPSNLLQIARDDSPEWLYRKMYSFWSHWLPTKTIKTITKDGFYAVKLREGLKLISLNTNFCHQTNFWLYINSTDPGNQLKWLIHELQLSELEHEQVHIIGHIPPGINECLKVWSKNFNRILRRFSNTISGQFFGHTHRDEFEVFYNTDGSDCQSLGENNSSDSLPLCSWKPISVGFVGPSITTFVGVNPSFRIYSIDPSKNYMPTNFETYFMNLTDANIHAGSEQPKWISAGLFTDQFGLQDTSPSSMHDLLVEMVKDVKEEEQPKNPFYIRKISNSTSSSEKLYKLYRLTRTFSDTFNEDDFGSLTHDAKKTFLCGFFTGQSRNFRACNQFIRDNLGFNYAYDS